jgi:ComF family protein
LDSLGRALGAGCACCGGAGEADGFCRGCRDELPWLDGPQCRQCAQPLSTPGLCGRCLTDPPRYDRVHAACRYAYPLDGLIQQAKYGGRLQLLRGLAALLARCAPAQADLIVPMPLSAARLRERGYNQALELARLAATALDAPLDAAICIKLRDTAPQSRLPWSERRRNVRGAFVTLADLGGRHVVVVDDVLTTGATLDALAGSLKKAGAASVSGWVVARTAAR